jgi:CheY-like chemotaxis protein
MNMVLDARSGGSPLELLLIEDGLIDARLTIEAIKRCGIHHHLTLIRDGEDAMDFLHRRRVYARAPRPDVVLLDLFLPKVDGFEVLESIRREPALSDLPVVVLTSSDEAEDRNRAERLQVQHFIGKPFDEHQFLQVIRQMQELSLVAGRDLSQVT